MMEYCYAFECEPGVVKVGKSVNNPYTRLKQGQGYFNHCIFSDLHFVGIWRGYNAEEIAHSALSKFRSQGDQFMNAREEEQIGGEFKNIVYSRKSNARELFSISVEEARKILLQHLGKPVGIVSIIEADREKRRVTSDKGRLHKLKCEPKSLEELKRLSEERERIRKALQGN